MARWIEDSLPEGLSIEDKRNLCLREIVNTKIGRFFLMDLLKETGALDTLSPDFQVGYNIGRHSVGVNLIKRVLDVDASFLAAMIKEYEITEGIK